MNVLKNMVAWVWKNKIKMIVLIGIIGGGFYYWQQKQNSGDSASNKLKTAIVEKGDIEILVSGSGQVDAGSQVDLQPQIAGDGADIVSVAVENDQEVKENDIIAILDTEDAIKDLRDAKLSLQSSQLRQKQIEKENYRKTEDDKLIRQIQEAEIQGKLNKLADANEELADYYVRAPFDGIVTGLDVEVGDSVSRDDVLASVITKEMIANISLNELDAVKVTKGAVANLTFSALDGVEVVGEVSKMDTIGKVSQGVVSYDAEISFNAEDAPGLKPGMSVEAEIIVEAKTDILNVPVAAIQSDRRGGDFVMVVAEGTSLETIIASQGNSENTQSSEDKTSSKGPGNIEGLTRVSVESGITDDIMIEVSGEISAGDVVLTQTLESLMSISRESKTGADAGTGTESSAKSLIPTMGGKGMGGGGRR